MKPARLSSVILVAALLAVDGALSEAGVVVLKSGRRVEGKIVKSDKDGVTVETFDGTLTFKNEEIKAVSAAEKSAYENYVELETKTEKNVEGHLKLADLCLRGAGWDVAKTHLDLAKELEPKNEKVASMLARLATTQEAWEIAQAKADPTTAIKKVPKAPGQWLIQGKDRKYWVVVPKGAPAVKPLPIVLVFSWNTTQNREDVDLGEWKGFEGFVVVAEAEYTWSPGLGEEMIECVAKVFKVERQEVLVVAWRGRAVVDLVGKRPDLFQYGFDDSTLGSGEWPGAAAPDEERRKLYEKVHVYHKLTGAAYKPADPGFDDAKAKKVEEYWKTLGVKDTTVERYAANPKPGTTDYGCIGQSASARARKWFEKKLADVRPTRKP